MVQKRAPTRMGRNIEKKTPTRPTNTEPNRGNCAPLTHETHVFTNSPFVSRARFYLPKSLRFGYKIARKVDGKGERKRDEQQTPNMWEKGSQIGTRNGA